MSSDRCRLESSSDETAYKRNQKRSVIFLVLLAVILLATILISMWAGSYDTPLNELLRGIIGRSSDQKINIVVQNVRLPRICTAAIAGAGLGVTGCILQAILNNPLASSSTLGVSQGAGFGAAFAIIILGAGSSANGNLVIPVCAFVGSMAVAIVIFALSRFCQISAESVVLAGVAISSMFTGATTLLQYFADEVELNAMVFWTFGDLGSTDWKEIGFMLVVVVVSGVYFVLHRWDFNALLSGTETATSLGIHVRRLIIVNMILCCFTASTIVSYIGLISFIGLVAPHIVRMVVGNHHVYLIPGSMLAGAVLLLLGDLAARTLISPIILPIGAITSFLGAPLFLYLLFKGGSRSC
nr:iron ABC transporter permease [uncultured Blautia sp.]